VQRVLLDTSILIDLANGKQPATTTVHDLVARDADVCVCAVVISEFVTGLRPEQRSRWMIFFATLRFLSSTSTAAVRAGAYRHDVARRGRALSTGDTLIAAIAYEAGAVVLTEDPKDFPMDDIVVRSLRA